MRLSPSTTSEKRTLHVTDAVPWENAVSTLGFQVGIEIHQGGETHHIIQLKDDHNRFTVGSVWL